MLRIRQRIAEGSLPARSAILAKCVARGFASPRYFPWLVLMLGTSCAMALWIAGPLRATTPAPFLPPEPRGAVGGRAVSAENHWVAPGQLAESNAVVRRALSAFSGETHDGRQLDWDDLSKGQPVVLVFIKEGCPCNVEFESFFSRVKRLYRGVVRFAGVIDGDGNAARRYVENQHLEYPVLADPERRLIGKFEARNGCYFALLTAEGRLDGLWPGCSADALCDLARRIAALAGVEERLPDVSGMPAALTTGCPFAE